MMVVGVLQEFILNFPMQGETIMSKFGKYILNTKLKCPPIGDARHPQLYQLLVHASFDD